MKATVDAATQTAGAVPTDAEFNADYVAVKKSGTGTTMVDAVIPDPEVSPLRGDGQFVVTIDYSLEPDGLPLYVTVANAGTVSMINGMAADGTPTPALMVGTAPDTTAPTVSDDAPDTAITGATTVTLTFSEDVSGVTVTGNPTGETAKYMTSAVTGTGMTRMVTITPTAAADLTADVAETAVTFTVAGQDAAGNAIAASTTFMVTLAARTAPGNGNGGTTPVVEPTEKTPVIRIATVNDSSGPIELGSRFVDPMIPAHGWAVLVRDVEGSRVYPPGNTWIRSVSTSLPDLALFLGGRGGINSGTISLHQPAGGTAVADDIVISEIMWGVDNVNEDDPTCSQWIEFYNATPRAIDLTGWTINFHRSLVDERNWQIPTLVDFVSNAGVTDRYPVHKYHQPWAPPGQSGLFSYGATGANIVSMFLEINYTQARNVKHTVPSGAAAGSWSASVYPQSNLPFGVVATPGAATEIRISYTETPISQKLIINEIGNSDEDQYDWVEIYNPTDGNQSTKDIRFTTVTNTGPDTAPVGKEEILFTFPDQTIKPGHYVVFAASDPKKQR